jgi:hypothetical protein
MFVGGLQGGDITLAHRAGILGIVRNSAESIDPVLSDRIKEAAMNSDDAA